MSVSVDDYQEILLYCTIIILTTNGISQYHRGGHLFALFLFFALQFCLGCASGRTPNNGSFTGSCGECRCR